MDSRILEKIYHNSFSKIPMRLSQATVHRGGVEMKFNSHGFRSPEFSKDVDFLFSGCSVTEGAGLSKKNIWLEISMKSLKGSYSSVAKSGDSINGQIRKIFAYINQYGNPKNIVCLFPNLGRIQIFSSKDLFVTDEFVKTYNKDAFKNAIDSYIDDPHAAEYLNSLYIDSAVARVEDNQKKNEFFKRPLIASDVIPLEMSHMYSAQSITMLSQYCRQAGINLIWGTWDEGSGNIIKKMSYNNFFNDYVDLHKNKWNYNTELSIDEIDHLNCHIEYSHDQEFHLALDTQNGKHNAHFGMHRHLHYAEEFTHKILELNYAKN